MLAIFINWLSTAVGLGIATLLLKGIQANNFLAFAIAATVLGLINAFIRPALWLLTAPLSVLTFGLFALVINALMIMLAAKLVPNFEVKSFGSAFLAAIIIAIAGLISSPWLDNAEISWSSHEFYSQP